MNAPTPRLEQLPQPAAPIVPVEAHSLAPRLGQHDQHINTAGVYRSANAQASETQADYTGVLPEAAEHREVAAIAVSLGSVAARGVAMAPEASYAEEFRALRGHFYNSHVAYLEQMRQGGEFYAHRRPKNSEEEDDEEDDVSDDQAARIIAAVRAKGHGPAKHNSLHNNPN